MRSQRRKQVMTLSILAVAIIGLSVGFAAFSSILRIDTTAQVNPDANAFKVVFSSSATALVTNPIVPSPADKGDEASITNSPVPAVYNLTAQFKRPGDSVSYTFYVRNEGEYLAYLNSITFRDKVCEPGPGVTQSYAQSACEAITAEVSVGTIRTTETMLNITGESLNPGQSKAVTVEITYDENGALLDGPLTVQFGAISMYYATATGLNEPDTKCTIVSGNVSTRGSEIDCAGERFYVMSNEGSVVTTLSRYNIRPILDLSSLTGYNTGYNTGYSTGYGATGGFQLNDGSSIGVPFSSTAYWENGNYSPAGSSDFDYVYDSNSNLYKFVETYETYLRINGIDGVSATLMSVEQAETLGCNVPSNGGCSAAPYWVSNVERYWIGSVCPDCNNGIGQVWHIANYGFFAYSHSQNAGIRPVVTIPVTEIQ